MIIKSSFKSVSRESNIGLVWPIIGRNGGLVHYRFGEALAQHGTFVGFSTITLLALLVGLFGQYGLVSIDGLLNATHTTHTTIAWSRVLKNDCPTLVATFLLKGALYHIIFLCRFFLWLV